MSGAGDGMCRTMLKGGMLKGNDHVELAGLVRSVTGAQGARIFMCWLFLLSHLPEGGSDRILHGFFPSKMLYVKRQDGADHLCLLLLK